MTKKLLLVLFVIALQGCASARQVAPLEKEIRRSAVLNKDYDSTWNAVIEWFAIQNTPLDKIDKEDGLITSNSHLRASNEIDCGKPAGQISWASAKFENIGGNVNVVVRKVNENETRVLVTVFGRGDITIRNGFGAVISSAEARCVSTGVLEESLFQYLEQQ